MSPASPATVLPGLGQSTRELGCVQGGLGKTGPVLCPGPAPTYVHVYLCPAELVYDDVFSVWETIWAAKHVSSAHYVLFIALALVEVYRDIILENNMDFTDIIKFFNGTKGHEQGGMSQGRGSPGGLPRGRAP